MLPQWEQGYIGCSRAYWSWVTHVQESFHLNSAPTHLPSTLCIPYRPAPLPHMPVSLSLSCLLSLYSNLLAHIHMQRCASHHSHALYCIPDPLHPDPVCLCVLCRLVSRVAISAALARSRCSWATRTLMQRWQGWHSCAWGGLPGLWPCLYLCLLCIYISTATLTSCQNYS